MEASLKLLTLLFSKLIPVDNNLKLLALPFPMLILEEDNLKLLMLSVDVVPMIGRDTEPIVDVSETTLLKGGVTV